MYPLEKSPKINKRTPMFIPESRVRVLKIPSEALEKYFNVDKMSHNFVYIKT